jgi:hypothetical protein
MRRAEDVLGRQKENISDKDLAYCLLGLFNMNMPMIYGEG